MRTTNFTAAAVAAALSFFGTLQPVAAQNSPGLSREAINSATFKEGWREDKAFLIKAQVLLNRARFSPGAIDSRWGMNTERAVRAFQQRHKIEATGELNEETWDRLRNDNGQNVLTEYEITQSDVHGPFIDRVPEDFQEMSRLKALSYTGPEELLAEKFHMNIDLLRELNPGASFREAGQLILVTEVRDETQPIFEAARMEVDKSDQSVRVLGIEGNIVAYYPATIGSNEMPSPSGTLKVKRVAKSPHYRYDPKKLSFPGVDLERAVKIAPGPNSPVGLAWIGLSQEGYGIHGTANPEEIRRDVSHGCVRLTNWDAIELANATKPGAAVTFVD